MEIDTSWIEEFDKIDGKYNMFYKTEVNQIELAFLYVGRDNKLFHIKKEKLDIETGILSKERLIELLNINMTYNNKNYRPIAILKYNIDIDPENVKDFIMNPEKYNFLTSEKNIDILKWKKTIELFNSINSLYILFYEKWKTSKNGTRKIYIKNGKKLNHRKTKKKVLKANHKNYTHVLSTDKRP